MTTAISKLVFLIMVVTPAQQREAEILIDSVRSFGGEFRQAPVYVVLSNPSSAPCRNLQTKGVQLLALEMNEAHRPYPFADKVYACSQMERLLAQKTETIVWLNPDVLVLNPISEAALKPNHGAAVRPLHPGTPMPFMPAIPDRTTARGPA